MLSCPHHRLQKTALEAIEDMVLAEDVVAAGVVSLTLHALQLHRSKHMYDAFGAARQKPLFHSLMGLQLLRKVPPTYCTFVCIEFLSLHAPQNYCKLPTNVFMLTGIVAPLMTILKSEENSLVLQAADFIGQFRHGKGRAFVQAGEALYLSATTTASAQVFHSHFRSLA